MAVRQYLCIDQKSFYATVECVARGLDPMTTDLVVADPERSENTICLAVSPSLKAKGVSNRCRIIIADQYVPRDSTLFQRNCIGNFVCTIAQFADDNTTAPSQSAGICLGKPR